jgi:hypothetical protein
VRNYTATWTRIGWIDRLRTRERISCIACERPARWRQTLTHPAAGSEVTCYCDDHAFPEGMIVSGL